jgi:uncharacterized membrane protein
MLGVLLIVAAIYTLDFNYWNQIIISALLFLSGVHLFLLDSKNEFSKLLSKFLQKTALILAVILIIKLFIIG